MTDNYLSPAELRGIADACEQLSPLWELLTSGPMGNVSFDTGNEAPHILCHDSNGDTLGYISWGEDGAVFYIEPKDVESTSTPKGVWALPDTECGRCHSIGTIFGYNFFDEKNEMQHTHYVCTYWESGHDEGLSDDTGRCGWHGWRADEKADWD